MNPERFSEARRATPPELTERSRLRRARSRQTRASASDRSGAPPSRGDSQPTPAPGAPRRPDPPGSPPSTREPRTRRRGATFSSIVFQRGVRNLEPRNVQNQRQNRSPKRADKRAPTSAHAAMIATASSSSAVEPAVVNQPVTPTATANPATRPPRQPQPALVPAISGGCRCPRDSRFAAKRLVHPVMLRCALPCLTRLDTKTK